MKRLLIAFIHVYQALISPHLGNVCRFHPTCSNYAILAIEHYGVVRGGAKSIWRILRCNPFNKGGVDYP